MTKPLLLNGLRKAIATVEDLQYAAEWRFISHKLFIHLGTNPRGSYAGDFGLYADIRGSDFQCIGKNNQATDVSKYQATKNSADASNFYKRFYLSLARINKIFDSVQKAELKGIYVEALWKENCMLFVHYSISSARLFAKLPSNAQDDDLGIVLYTGMEFRIYIGEKAHHR
ncbi:MAG: hypothetical protein V8R07_11160 [Bacteroides fragilis]